MNNENTLDELLESKSLETVKFDREQLIAFRDRAEERGAAKANAGLLMALQALTRYEPVSAHGGPVMRADQHGDYTSHGDLVALLSAVRHGTGLMPPSTPAAEKAEALPVVPLPEPVWHAFCTKCGASDDSIAKPESYICGCGYERLITQAKMYTADQMHAHYSQGYQFGHADGYASCQRRTAADAGGLSQRLRDTVQKLRRTPMPVADIIPMLQQAADALDADRPGAVMAAGLSDRAEQAAILGTENQCRDELLAIAKEHRQPAMGAAAMPPTLLLSVALSDADAMALTQYIHDLIEYGRATASGAARRPVIPQPTPETRGEKGGA